jgi:hypothetical protein
MANAIQRTILIDGNRHAVMHFFITSDGSGDLVNEVVIDPVNDFQDSTFQYQGVTLGVDEIWWDTASQPGVGFTGVLTYDSSTNPQQVWALSSNPGDTHIDFRSIGGIKDKTGIDGTGKLLITTKGFSDPNSSAVLIVSVKKYARPVSQYPMGAIGGPTSESNNSLEVPQSSNAYGGAPN